MSLEVSPQQEFVDFADNEGGIYSLIQRGFGHPDDYGLDEQFKAAITEIDNAMTKFDGEWRDWIQRAGVTY